MPHHCGPDANGQYHETHVWLARTRSSIIDLSPAGKQPMKSTDGRFVFRYNGEVYNYKSLEKNDLENLRSNSDTEFDLKLFVKLGVNSLTMLNGMFASAIYDVQATKLWLVRDRLEIKPLFYQPDEKRLTYGSEVKVIVALNSEQLIVDVTGLRE